MNHEREFVLAVLGKQEDPFQLAVLRSLRQYRDRFELPWRVASCVLSQPNSGPSRQLGFCPAVHRCGRLGDVTTAYPICTVGGSGTVGGHQVCR